MFKNRKAIQTISIILKIHQSIANALSAKQNNLESRLISDNEAIAERLVMLEIAVKSLKHNYDSLNMKLRGSRE